MMYGDEYGEYISDRKYKYISMFPQNNSANYHWKPGTVIFPMPSSLGTQANAKTTFATTNDD